MRNMHNRIIILLAMVLSVACQAETENSTKIQIENEKQSVPMKQQSQELSLAELKRLALLQLETGKKGSGHLQKYFEAWAGNDVTYEQALEYYDTSIYEEAITKGLHEENLSILNKLMVGFFKQGKNIQGDELNKRIESYLKEYNKVLGDEAVGAWSYVISKSFAIFEESWRGKLKAYSQVKQNEYLVQSYISFAKSNIKDKNEVLHTTLYLIGLLAIRAESKTKLQEVYDELVLINKEGSFDKDKKRYRTNMTLFKRALDEMNDWELKNAEQ